jgi:predicted ArsR family transcriptional regulator
VSTQRIGTAAGVSRALVLEVLRASARPWAAEAVAEAVGLSVNTVRFHLDRLRNEGLVTRRAARPEGPGRPHLVYRAVAAEAVDRDAAYRLLAGVLAEGLVRGDAKATIEAGRSWGDRLVAAHDPAAGGGTGMDANRAALERVVELLEDGGFAPEAQDDERTIALHRCPFMDLASVRADVVCTVHLGFVRGALQRMQAVADASGRISHQLDADLVRLRPVLDGSGPCLVSLPAPRIRPHPG